MTVLNKKIKIILSFFSLTILLGGTLLGITKEGNLRINTKENLNQENQDYLRTQGIQEQKATDNQLLTESLEQDENNLIYDEYSQDKEEEVFMVSCAGFF